MLAFRSFMTGVLAALPGAALACDLALALAVDVSGSVDSNEYRLQMDGLAAGLRDPIVSEALVRAQAQVMLVHWSGSTRQVTSIPWTQIAGFGDLEQLARAIEVSPRPWRNFSTAVGEALLHAGAGFAQVPECHRRVIDVSGDGPSNEGVAPAEVQSRLREWGITVNAIAIEATEPELTAWFFENVIRGEGAFVITARDFHEYPSKIRRKLLREVVEQTAGLKETDCGGSGCIRKIH